jgi:membrane protein
MGKLKLFFDEDIWLLNVREFSFAKGLLIKSIKLLLLAFRGFSVDHCALRASALTLYTLLSIVPIIAMLFGIAKGFGFEKKLEEKIFEHVPKQDTMMLQIIEFAQNLLANTKGGLVAGIGIAVLFWTVIKVISNIEQSFNHIWKIEKGRSASRKLSDYLSLMMLAPVLIILASSISVYVSTKISALMGAIHISGTDIDVSLYLLNFLPIVIIWTLFTFIFIFMPNTKVNYASGILAGVITGTLYQLVQMAYVNLQLGVTSYNAIYGSFAALPLFLIWLQIGWFIVLFGAELAYYHQNFANYRHHDKFSNLSFSVKKIISLQIAHLIVQQFVRDDQALTEAAISQQLALSPQVVKAMLQELQNGRIIVSVQSDENEFAYQPARDTNNLTIATVINALEHNGNNEWAGDSGSEYFSNIIQQLESRLKDTNMLLKELNI